MNRENVKIRNTEYKFEFNIQYILMETISRIKTPTECKKFIFKKNIFALVKNLNFSIIKETILEFSTYIL